MCQAESLAIVPGTIPEASIVADSAEATGLKWQAASSGGMTLINTGGTTLSGSSVQVASIPSGYNYLYCEVVSFRPGTDGADLRLTFNNNSGTNYTWAGPTFNQTSAKLTDGGVDNGNAQTLVSFSVPSYTNTTTWKFAWAQAAAVNSTTPANIFFTNYMATTNQTSAITSIELIPSTGTFGQGTFYVWGVK